MESGIRYLKPEEKRQARALWENAFAEDSQSFNDYYFTEKIKSNRILVKEEDGKIVSMLHRNPYRVRLGKKEQTLDYIVGVATEEPYRRRGYMGELLKQALSDACSEKKAFCYLMPADEAIYKPFGFRFVYDQKYPEITGKVLGEIPEAEESWKIVSTPAKKEWNYRELADFMEAWMENRYEVYAVRDPEYAKALVKELASENGVIERIYRRGRLEGLRAFWGLEEREQRLLYCPEGWTAESKPQKPSIMARIASLKSFLELGRLKPGNEEPVEAVIWAEDPLIEENQGLWLWKLDGSGSRAQRISESPADKENVLSCDVSQLVQWLLGYKDWNSLSAPQDTPVWMERIRGLKGIFLDETV